jgi:hypothetical protein
VSPVKYELTLYIPEVIAMKTTNLTRCFQTADNEQVTIPPSYTVVKNLALGHKGNIFILYNTSLNYNIVCHTFKLQITYTTTRS